jgi:hypothetical protein
MNTDQIQNWRRVLSMQLGAYALIMPEEQIIAIRNKLQSQVDAINPVDLVPENSNCLCDRDYYGQTIHADGRVTCNKCNKMRL